MSRVFSTYCGYDVIAGDDPADAVLHHHSASKCVANQLEIRRLGTAIGDDARKLSRSTRHARPVNARVPSGRAEMVGRRILGRGVEST